MALGARWRGLDDRVLRNRGTPSRQAWFRAYGWLLFLGVAFTFFLIGTVLVGDVAEPGPGTAFLVALGFLIAALGLRRRAGL